MPTTVIHKNFTGADAVHPAAFVQATDPGNVGANLFWIDTSTVPPAMKIRNATNTAWTAFGVGSVGPAGANGTAGATGPAGTNIVSGAAPYICMQDQKTQNTSGGTFTSGADQTRTLNTIVANDQFLATLASNQIILPAGTYRVSARVPAAECDRHQAWLHNVTDNVVLLRGTSEFAGAASTGASASQVSGRFALASPKTMEIRHRCQTTAATLGFGIAANFGIEVYTIAEFWLEAGPPPFMGSTVSSAGQIRHIARARQDFAQHSLNTPPQ